MPETFYIHACCLAVAWAIEAMDDLGTELEPFEVVRFRRVAPDSWALECERPFIVTDREAIVTKWRSIDPSGALYDDDDMAQPYRHALTSTDQH